MKKSKDTSPEKSKDKEDKDVVVSNIQSMFKSKDDKEKSKDSKDEKSKDKKSKDEKSKDEKSKDSDQK